METRFFIIYINEPEDDAVDKNPKFENKQNNKSNKAVFCKCKIVTNTSWNKEPKERIVSEQ